jgi:hypothetical protein
MPSTQIERRFRRANALARRNDQLIERAAKRTDLAGAALAGAAGDLDGAHGRDGNALTGLAEVIRHEVVYVSHLVEDIESHRDAPDNGG